MIEYGPPTTVSGRRSLRKPWLAWAGVVIGAVTTLAAVGLFLDPSLFPGFLLYGVLASVVAQLWLLTTGMVMLRRSRGPEKV